MKFLSIILISCLIVALSEAAPKKPERKERQERGPPKGKRQPRKQTDKGEDPPELLTKVATICTPKPLLPFNK